LEDSIRAFRAGLTGLRKSPCSTRSQSDAGAGVVVPARAGANVASRNRNALPAALTHDRGLGLGGSRRLRREAAAQRVRRGALRIEPAAIEQAIDRGASKYTAVTGIPSLKEAICAATTRRRGWTPTPNQVCVTVGAKHALFNLALALFEAGDEVVIPSPCWVSYPEQVRMVGATPVLVPTSEATAWRLTPDALGRSLNSQTDLRTLVDSIVERLPQTLLVTR